LYSTGYSLFDDQEVYRELIEHRPDPDFEDIHTEDASTSDEQIRLYKEAIEAQLREELE
jgi:hypothetical protein